VRWSKILTGKARPDIDEFLDQFIKDIDENILKDCIEHCRENIERSREHIETLIDFYEEKLEVTPTRYMLGYLLYSYLDVTEQIKLAKLKMRTHDSWRLFDPCIVLSYMSKKYGKEGVEITVVHMILDEIARLSRISFTDARKGVEIMVNFLRDVASEYGLDEIFSKIRSNMKDMIFDVAFSIGINFRSWTPIRHILVVRGEKADRIVRERLGNGLEIYSVNELGPDKSMSIVRMVREFSRRCKVRVRLRYNPVSGLVELDHGKLLVVELKTGKGAHVVVFPHIVNLYSIGDVQVNIEDYVRDLAVMRPGSMRDDLKGGH